MWGLFVLNFLPLPILLLLPLLPLQGSLVVFPLETYV